MDKKEKNEKFLMNEELNLLVRKFSKFLSRSKRNKRKSFARPKGKDDSYKGNNDVICYEYKSRVTFAKLA